MRAAVLTDVHGNLEALQAVLDDAGGRADGFVCLGDIVGYGGDPEACVDLIAARSAVAVGGNHDQVVAGRLTPRAFTPLARAAAEWTASALSDPARAWLGALPLETVHAGARLVHASPVQPELWDYVVVDDDAWTAFGGFTERLCWVGHTHVPSIWSEGSAGRWREPAALPLRFAAGRRYLVNPGSVGQPRDGDPRAAYAIWDAAAATVEIRRVAYDVAGAQARMHAHGLDGRLSARLSEAR